MSVSRKEILKGRDVEYPLTPELESNLVKLLEALNKLRALWKKPMVVTSGYRPGHYNKSAGGAKNSAHLTCEAADISDLGGELKKFCTPEILKKCGLYMEDPGSTPSWAHLQIRPTRSRIFTP